MIWPAFAASYMAAPRDAIQHPLDVNVDHPVQFVDLEALDWRCGIRPALLIITESPGATAAPSPSNFTASPEKLSGQRVRRIGSQPDGRVRTLLNRGGSVWAAHIGAD